MSLGSDYSLSYKEYTVFCDKTIPLYMYIEVQHWCCNMPRCCSLEPTTKRGKYIHKDTVNTHSLVYCLYIYILYTQYIWYFTISYYTLLQALRRAINHKLNVNQPVAGVRWSFFPFWIVQRIQFIVLYSILLLRDGTF